MINLHKGQIDQASRAAAAILAVHRGYSPKQTGSGLNAVLFVDMNFLATSGRRWEPYCAACLFASRRLAAGWPSHSAGWLLAFAEPSARSFAPEAHSCQAH